LEADNDGDDISQLTSLSPLLEDDEAEAGMTKRRAPRSRSGYVSTARRGKSRIVGPTGSSQGWDIRKNWIQNRNAQDGSLLCTCAGVHGQWLMKLRAQHDCEHGGVRRHSQFAVGLSCELAGWALASVDEAGPSEVSDEEL
jgi:hypothetical protein